MEELTFAEWFGRDLTGKTYHKSINCSASGITSFEGAPEIVEGNFECRENLITSLKHAPRVVCKNFDCRDNQSLTTTKGDLRNVGGSCWFDRCHYLTNLGDIESIGDDLSYQSCYSLTSIIGFPKNVGGLIELSYCKKLESLVGFPPDLKMSSNAFGGRLIISHCDSIKNLIGLPETIECDIIADEMRSLETLEGIPRESKDLMFNGCISLRSISDILNCEFRNISLRNCTALESVDELLHMPQFNKLNIEGCSTLENCSYLIYDIESESMSVMNPGMIIGLLSAYGKYDRSNWKQGFAKHLKPRYRVRGMVGKEGSVKVDHIELFGV